MIESWAPSGDLAFEWVVVACVLAALSVGLLVVELARERTIARAPWVALSGIIAVSALLLAVLRPVRIEERGASVGARVVVLLDASRSIDLPADDAATGPLRVTRRKVTEGLLPRLTRHFSQLRSRTLTFGKGAPLLPTISDGGKFESRPEPSSDLSAALEAIASSTDELPEAIVLVSDGRLDRPAIEQLEANVHRALGDLRVPVHTVALATKEPADASILSVAMAGAVVAHQPVALRVEVLCSGGLECGEIPVSARELHLDGPAIERASGTASVVEGRATVELEVTLDRAGERILEVAIDAPDGDRIADNDRRFLTVDVARDRIRLLHIAGRPTYDVRALRTWLKSDASVDVVAFFILRTHTDDVVARQEELALIPFPVDELFTVHLASFDAVVLQDFDALEYKLTKHLPRLANYVRQGGGLIMVGGPDAFVSGNYARTELATVLPVDLDGIAPDAAVDLASFEPRVTHAGKFAPVLEPLRALLGDTLPEMPGTNVVGQAREGATVLLEHPSLMASAGGAMPVLALGEYGSGRSIALTVDGSHKLSFSRFAADAAGRAHGAFWDALLGWLMRDPRFEPAKVELPDGCIAGVPVELALKAAFVEEGTKATVSVERMGRPEAAVETEVVLKGGSEPAMVRLGALEAGGYTATVRLARKGTSAPSRYDFACEVGGDEWADPRPDRERMTQIAAVTGGVAVDADDVERLPRPEAARVVTERRVRPLGPAWAWSLIAAACLGGHWIVRRRGGLS